MANVITALIILVCILLILVVLIQNSKGGGLSSQFAGSNQIMGVRRTADFLEKATYTLAIVLLVLSLLSSANISKGGVAKAAEAPATSDVKANLNTNVTSAPAIQLQKTPTPVTPAAPAKNSPKKPN